ncbi:hypothetical protein DY052_06175 [Apilactobacillus timberlakei]|uniref:hypothetical protein n=1 Tax=Apilactobacillus timberlakei TaxID=2008380 RepID=UPI001126E1BD|nr:hypothetical protein [Apilactobacillus timberlakei]TPR15010.1 hypothetical protein DY052_06175 [Apilactobacillus timberlakei]
MDKNKTLKEFSSFIKSRSDSTGVEEQLTISAIKNAGFTGDKFKSIMNYLATEKIFPNQKAKIVLKDNSEDMTMEEFQNALENVESVSDETLIDAQGIEFGVISSAYLFNEVLKRIK